MAYSVNKVTLLGNVGADPEVRYTKSGKAVAQLRVATEEGWGDKKRTEWHSVVVWDKLAELAGNLAPKGSKVCVTGRLQTREYQDRDGNTRKATEVVAQDVVFLGSGKAESRGPGRSAEQRQPQRQGGGGYAAPPGVPYADDADIPFAPVV